MIFGNKLHNVFLVLAIYIITSQETRTYKSIIMADIARL